MSKESDSTYQHSDQSSSEKNLPSRREEIIHLTEQNSVSEFLTFQKGETCFMIEANIVRRDFLLLSLGGFDMSGQITTFRSRDTEKEFPVREFQWLIIKADHLKNNESLEIKVKFK